MTVAIIFAQIVLLIAAILITRAQYLRKIEVLKANHKAENDETFIEGWGKGYDTGWGNGRTRASYDRIMKVK